MGSTIISGTLNSTASTNFRLEFFSNTSCDGSGNGEGETYLGFTNVTTDGSGNATFTNVNLGTTAPGGFITATATDPSNNTSEFSQCFTLIALTAPTVVSFSGSTFDVSGVDFDWNAVSGASTYTVQYADNTSFSNSTEITGITSTKFLLSTLLTQSTYYWHVRAFGSNTASVFSSTDSFVIPAFPLFSNNKGTRTAEGGTVTLSTAMLQFTDGNSTTAQIVYTIGTAPAWGQLQKSSAAIGAGGTFTQDDIDNGRISYVHRGGEHPSDDFAFTVHGSAGVPTSSFSFGLAITPVNDPPALDVLQEVPVDEGGTIVISNGYLRVLDGDTHATRLTFSVHEGPFYGRLGRNTFTQADIDNSLVSYVPSIPHMKLENRFPKVP